MMTTGKAYTAVMSTMAWCQTNPLKLASIVRPEGTYRLIFQPNHFRQDGEATIQVGQIGHGLSEQLCFDWEQTDA